MNSIKTYIETVSFIESLSNASNGFRRTPKQAKKHLERLKLFLAFLGNPQKKLKIIHIAGTSGKGSVSTMLHSIFFHAGKKVGLYTSPHTTTFAERIKVGDKYINETDLVRLTNFLKDKMDEYIKEEHKFQTLNFFEFTICLSLFYFAEQGCEFLIMEAGCGGRYDSTNVISHPVYTIITNIGLDHLDLIGPTLKDIAYEKVGIIKKGAPFLTGERRKSLLKIFTRELKKITDYKLRTANYKELKNIKANLDGTEFEYKKEKYKLHLLGEHQAKNATLAIECAKYFGVSTAEIKKGLLNASYPARLEIISKNPLIIIDGAHNADKIKATIEFLKINRSALNAKRYLIIGMARNKKAKNSIFDLADYFDSIYFTRFENPFRKAYTFSDWTSLKFAKNSKKKIYYKHRAIDALLDILPKLRNNDLLLITGSIFLAGELRKHWYPEEKIIKLRSSTKR